jgi:DNA-binding transcriptional LysR family regulator
VAAADYAESAILLPALAGLRAAAPKTRLAVVEAVPTRMARQLEQSEIDLFFHTSVGAPPGLHRRELFHERNVLAGRAGHPRLKRRPTLAQFVGARGGPHAALRRHEQRVVEELTQLGELHAHRGLREVQALGRAGHVALGQQGVERDQQVEVDAAEIVHGDTWHSNYSFPI